MKKIQLSIPEPCHENWDTMSPTQQGRFCNACTKEVIDFSNMSDSEVLNYFTKKKKDDKVCGRVYPDQLDRNIYAAAKKKKYWQWQYILTAFLFFMKPAKTKAQGMVVRMPADIPLNIVTEDQKKHNGKKIKISGVIKDEDGKPVPYASIKAVGSVVGAVADDQGKFSLHTETGVKTLEISCLNYETREATINEKEIVLTKKVKVMDEVMLTSYESRRMGSVSGGISVMRYKCYRERVKDTIKTWLASEKPSIKIYPNPVSKAGSFTINMKLKQTGNLSIQINDAAGRLITEKKINATSKEWNEQITVGSTWSAGVYYVKVLNEEKRAITTGSLVVW